MERSRGHFIKINALVSEIKKSHALVCGIIQKKAGKQEGEHSERMDVKTQGKGEV